MTVPLPADIQAKLQRGERVQLDVVSKALNSDFNVQPERMEPYWNARGVGINHWYHVKTVLDPFVAKGQVMRNISEYSNTPSGGTFKEQWGMHGWTSDPQHSTDPLAGQKKHHGILD